VVSHEIRCHFDHLLATARRRRDGGPMWLDGPQAEMSVAAGPDGNRRWRFTCARCRTEGRPWENVERREDGLAATLAALADRRSGMPYGSRQ
jgi:hypothetical protein